MSGVATSPDPDIYAYAATTVQANMDATLNLGGQNHVLWSGREGYETLLNTDPVTERAHAGLFTQQVYEYKSKIGFRGAILTEPKPQEPSKQEYDYDVATVYGFLKDFDLEKEVQVNIEQRHAILVGHSFEHEIALATSLGIFGSIDMNRNDYQ
jgi:xylose isomerase